MEDRQAIFEILRLHYLKFQLPVVKGLIKFVYLYDLSVLQLVPTNRFTDSNQCPCYCKQPKIRRSSNKTLKGLIKQKLITKFLFFKLNKKESFKV